MANLMGTMSIALGALKVNQEALDVTSNNIANLNTPGYSRQRANISEAVVVQQGNLQFGSGAQIDNIQSIRDQVLDFRIADETSQQSSLNAFLGPLQQVQTSFNEASGTGLQSSISGYFNSLSQLSTDPSSVPLRQNVINAGQTLASSFNNAANNLTAIKTSVDSQVPPITTQINTLTSSIAQLNLRISESQAAGENPGVLEDQRNEMIHKLSELVDVQVSQGDRGSVSVSTALGAALVVGQQSFALRAAQDPVSGTQHVFSNGADITSRIQGGQLGGILKVRDQSIPTLQNRLDTLASGIANAVNTAHTAGTDLNGAPGQNFFSVPATVANSAATISVRITDPAKIAAGLNGTSGDNSNALALAGLQSQNIAGGQKPLDYYSSTVSQLGTDIATAQSDSSTHDLVLQQLNDQRSSLSGVSLDEEAANLVRYQRAYQASARVVSVIDQLTSTAINIGSGTSA